MSSPKPEPTSKRLRARDNPREPAAALEAILAATDRVLATSSLAQISVERIIAEADVSRTAFYWHFTSKFDAVATLHRRFMAEYDIAGALRAGDHSAPSDDAIRSMLGEWVAQWRTHASIGRAVHENWHTDPLLGSQWLGLVERFSDDVGDHIDRQRSAGFAPSGPDSRQLAAALLWTTQELLYAANSALEPNVLDARNIHAILVAIWVGAIYAPATSKVVRRTA